jgi:hypothetical protein
MSGPSGPAQVQLHRTSALEWLARTATARTLALRTPVDRANQRFGNVCRISATLLAQPSQPASPPLLTVVSAKRSARGSKYG